MKIHGGFVYDAESKHLFVAVGHGGLAEVKLAMHHFSMKAPTSFTGKIISGEISEPKKKKVIISESIKLGPTGSKEIKPIENTPKGILKQANKNREIHSIIKQVFSEAAAYIKKTDNIETLQGITYWGDMNLGYPSEANFSALLDKGYPKIIQDLIPKYPFGYVRHILVSGNYNENTEESKNFQQVAIHAYSDENSLLAHYSLYDKKKEIAHIQSCSPLREMFEVAAEPSFLSKLKPKNSEDEIHENISLKPQGVLSKMVNMAKNTVKNIINVGGSSEKGNGSSSLMGKLSNSNKIVPGVGAEAATVSTSGTEASDLFNGAAVMQEKRKPVAEEAEAISFENH